MATQGHDVVQFEPCVMIWGRLAWVNIDQTTATIEREGVTEEQGWGTWLLINQTWEKPHGISFCLIMEASFGIGAYAANSIECFQLTSNSNYQKESSFLIIHTNLLNT